MSKRAFAFLALLLALCVAGSLLLGKYGFSVGDYARYVAALLRGESLKDFEVMHTLLLEIRLPRILACATTAKKGLASLVAYVPQTHAPSYDYSVFDVALMGALCRTPLFSSFSAADKKLAEQALEKMGIAHLKNAPYTKVSGGERQLAYIARTLVQGAKVIFMDEPTNGLDFGNQIRLLEMIKALGDEGYTFVQTTHYPRHAKFVSNLTLFIKDGEILAFGESEKLINSENIDKIYGINYERYEGML